MSICSDRYCDQEAEPNCDYCRLHEGGFTGDFKGRTEKESSDHYKQGDIECIDAIRAALTPEEFRGYCKGNVLKYVWREKYKGGDKDIEKAQDYLIFASTEKKP